jgi:hypothetical protein
MTNFYSNNVYAAQLLEQNKKTISTIYPYETLKIDAIIKYLILLTWQRIILRIKFARPGPLIWKLDRRMSRTEHKKVFL